MTEDKKINPDEYFKKVKSKKQVITKEYLITLKDIVEKKRKKCVATKQDMLLKKLEFSYKILKREIELVKEYNITNCVQYEDLKLGIRNVEDKAVKIIELKNYIRDIPDEVVKLLSKLQKNNVFDQYYIVFTDYTHETSKHVERERQKKDPILFGAFLDNDDKRSTPDIHERLYFLADWEDEYCNLTYDKLLEENVKKGFDINIDLIKDITEEEVTDYINSFNKKLNDDRFMINRREKPIKSFLKTILNKIIK
jgi:hypothetical protein